ncbi:MAG TPA: tRNA-uridine aminocarboxypropyltransferase [Polyangiaceae bacterium]|nr:tRNA-uridine aminocarboxypropyltransferase [Polyangiaceae bacterium]
MTSLLADPATPETRAHCYRCDKPRLACLCDRIPRIENRTPIVIVQHRRESRHPLGTVRIADLGLSERKILVVPPHARSDSTLPSWLPAGAGLLYPSAGASDLATLPAEARPSALVVIDGTWHQARALFRDHAWLRELPRYRLAPSEPSRYRIRREPAAHCISTIEAIVQALALLEPELAGTERLISAFDGLIDDQLLNAKQRAREPRNRAQRPAGYRALPRALLENFGNLLVVYGEAVRPEGEPDAETELVHWVALRVRDAARFDCVVRPRSGMPSAVRLAHLGLTREEVENGVDLAELRRRWLDFALDSDVLAAWNPRTLARFEACLGSATGGVGLKGVYRRVRGGTGDLDGVLSSEDSVMLPDALAESLGKVRGRARIRLENALRVVLLLRERAQHGAAKEKRKVLPPP